MTMGIKEQELDNTQTVSLQNLPGSDLRRTKEVPKEVQWVFVDVCCPNYRYNMG